MPEPHQFIFSHKMREAGSLAIRTCCLASLVYNMAFIQISIVMPLVFVDQPLPGLLKGSILALCYLTAAISIPFINMYLTRFGMEKALLYSNVAYVIANIILGFGMDAPDLNVIVPSCVIASSLMGFFISVQFTAEGMVVLKYSEKLEREQNIGLFRAT